MDRLALRARDVLPAPAGGHVEALPDGRYRLDLGGVLPPDWMGSLCAGLSARRIAVDHGDARQPRRGSWEAQLVLRPLDATAELRRIDYRQLALAGLRDAAARPRLTSFEIADAEGALAVSIRAPDELGLLGRLLGAFALQLLFVHEMQIRTEAREAIDRFVLRAVGGAAPGPVRRQALATALQALCAAR